MFRSLLLIVVLGVTGAAAAQSQPGNPANPSQPGQPADTNSTSPEPPLFAPMQQQAPPPPAHSNGPIRISGGVMAGQLVSRVDPVYPAEAKAGQVQGTVVLNALIGKDGNVEELQPISGPPSLCEAAMTAVHQWTYNPYLLNGNPVEVRTVITVNFNLPPSQASGSSSSPSSNENTQPRRPHL